MKPEIYTTRLVELTALKFVYTSAGVSAMMEFLGPSMGSITKARHPSSLQNLTVKRIVNGTDVGVDNNAVEGDYVIQNPPIGFYVIKEKTFELNYETKE